jgi:hypothetical protein
MINNPSEDSHKKRKLLDGSEVNDYDYPIDLILHTKAPGKWKLIDLETGQEYLGSEISHETFAELLRTKVAKSKIGSWFKTKGRVTNNGK